MSACRTIVFGDRQPLGSCSGSPADKLGGHFPVWCVGFHLTPLPSIPWVTCTGGASPGFLAHTQLCLRSSVSPRDLLRCTGWAKGPGVLRSSYTGGLSTPPSSSSSGVPGHPSSWNFPVLRTYLLCVDFQLCRLQKPRVHLHSILQNVIVSSPLTLLFLII